MPIAYREFRERYKECIRMLNGLEKTLERKVPERDRRWQVAEISVAYHADNEMYYIRLAYSSGTRNTTPDT